MKFIKYYISITIVFLTLSVGAQSSTVNQFLNSQLISYVSSDAEVSEMNIHFLRFDKIPDLNFSTGIQHKSSFDWIRRPNLMKTVLMISPVPGLPQFFQRNLQNGRMVLKDKVRVDLSLKSTIAAQKLLTPHPTSFDTGNIVQISTGSWIRVNKQYSFIFDLPFYFYSVNYDKAGADHFRDRVSIMQKSESRGEFLPLIYQLKIGMGIDF